MFIHDTPTRRRCDVLARPQRRNQRVDQFAHRTVGMRKRC